MMQNPKAWYDTLKRQGGATPLISPFWQQTIKIAGGKTVLNMGPQFSYDPDRGIIGIFTFLFSGQQDIGKPKRREL
jgi:hypothetical protein